MKNIDKATARNIAKISRRVNGIVNINFRGITNITHIPKA
jgi:hypothetical protein